MDKNNFIFIFLVLLVLISNFYFVNKFSKDNLTKENVLNGIINEKVIEGYSDNITLIISNYCNLYKEKELKIKCVNNFVKNSGRFEYNITKKVYTPDELLKKAGDCKSWTVFYRSIFSKLNIKNKLISTDNHIYLV